MKSNHLSKKRGVLSFLLAAAIGLGQSGLVNSAFAGGGHTEGNSGDGVYVGDQIMLRDFLQKGELDVVENNEKFLLSTPGFRDLIQDLAKVSPEFAIQILDELHRAKFWLTNKPLPILPMAETTTVERRAEVQIAIRADQDIVISMPSFERIEKSYILLHEALHGLIGGEGPMHHARVRSAVRYIRDHRTALKRDELNDFLSSLGDFVDLGWTSGQVYRDRVRVLLASESPLEERCELLNQWRNDYSFNFLGIVYPESLIAWMDAQGCSSESAGVLAHKIPAIWDLAHSGFEIPYFFIADVSGNPRPGWFASKVDRILWADDCKTYANPSLESEIAQFVSKVSALKVLLRGARSEWNQIHEQALRPQDEALRMAADQFAGYVESGSENGPVTLLRYEKEIRDAEGRALTFRQNFERNVRSCAE